MLNRIFGRLSHLGQSSWSIHNPLKGWTLSGLPQEELRRIIHTLSNAERAVVVVHKLGWDSWARLLFNEELKDLLEYENSYAELPPLPANLLQQDDFHDTRVVMPLRRSEPEIIDRKHSRYDLRVPIDILSQGRTFTSHTVDMSTGGIHIEDPLPPWVAGYFPVLVKTTEGTFEVNCTVVEDQKLEKKRLEIVCLEKDEEEPGLIQLKKFLSKLTPMTS